MAYINPPFNYTGSKFKIIQHLLDNFDYTKNVFIDVFTGGGSVYSNVLDKYDIICINDIIKDLVLIHKKLAQDPVNIINDTKKLASCKEDKEKYLKLRESYNSDKTPEKLWALILSCNSNFMRFNNNFLFNQTWGKRGWNKNTDKKTDLYIKELSKYKEKIKYSSKNFYDIPIKKNYMMYLDPPYLNTEAGYNAYWSKEMESKLYDYILKIDDVGASFMLSGVLYHGGKETELLSKLYKKFNYKFIEYNYNKVSKKGDKNTKEIIIFNYQQTE